MAFPYLDGLYDFIRGSEFLLLFSDEEGYILAPGGRGHLPTARENGLVKGLPQRIPAGHQRDRHGPGGPDPPPGLWGGALRGTCQLGLLRRIGLLPDGDIGGVVCCPAWREHVNDHWAWWWPQQMPFLGS